MDTLMRLSELEKGQKAKIVRIDAENGLKNRLMSFGVIRGADLRVEECAPAKKTIKIAIDATMIALRLEEAQQIEVAQ